MIKVVVADDEVNVCQLICNLVDWRSFDMEIVGVAHNGVEALELIRQHVPDLVVTDIRMPGYDGLDMIRRARELQENLDFIIISGYRHFEYAQRAVRYMVHDYLLKPIKKEELMATLEKMRQKYLRQRQQATQEEQLKLRMQSDRDKLRSGLFGEFLFKRGTLDALSVEEINREYHFHFQAGLFQAFVVKMDGPDEDYFHSTTASLMDKLAQRLTGLLTPVCYDLQMLASESRLYGIVNFEETKGVTVRRQLKVALEEMVIQAGVFGNMAVTLGLGEPMARPRDLRLSLETAEAAVSQRLYQGTGRLIEGGAAPASLLDVSPILAELHKSMELVLETLDRQALAAALEEFQKQCLGLDGLSGQALQQLAQSAHRAFLTLLSGRYVKAGSLEEATDRFARRVDLVSSADGLFGLLTKELTGLLGEVLHDLRQTEKKPVRIAKQYIQDNFAKNITLEELAGIVGFNPSYFSTLFKKESGQNFLEYLSEVRMNRARELLKETNKTIASICAEVGYSDLKHFTQSFKKHTGLKPNEFRKLFS